MLWFHRRLGQDVRSLRPLPIALLPVHPVNMIAGRQDLHDRCDLMVGELKRVQHAYGNGYLGAPPLCSLACLIAAALLGLRMAAGPAAVWPDWRGVVQARLIESIGCFGQVDAPRAPHVA